MRLPRLISPPLVAGLLAAAWVLLNLDAPLVEDGLFWWVPKGLLAAELGPRTVLAHTLPAVMEPGLAVTGTPPQWTGGLPDYAHPPLWYWWLGLFLAAAPTVQAVHLACLPPAVLAAAGFAALGARVGHRWSGLGVLSLPPVLAQMLRADLDLPLLAVFPWALLALLDRRWRRFAVLGFLAPWLKEPGVILAAPAVLACLSDRTVRLEALAPLLGLGTWALVHGGLAQPESLPTGLEGYWGDLGIAARILFFEQGRWLLLLGLYGLWQRGALRDRTVILGGLVVTWWVFFSAVGFFAGRGTLDSLTHVRYFLPGMAVATVLLARRWPWLPLLGLVYLRARSPFGPEASLYGLDAARAERDAVPALEAALAEGGRVWVGSYQAAGLSQPWAGIVEEPVGPVQIYSLGTDPRLLQAGDVLVVAAYGEPAGSLLRAVQTRERGRFQRGDAEVRLLDVVARWDEAGALPEGSGGTPGG